MKYYRLSLIFCIIADFFCQKASLNKQGKSLIQYSLFSADFLLTGFFYLCIIVDVAVKRAKILKN